VKHTFRSAAFSRSSYWLLCISIAMIAIACATRVKAGGPQTTSNNGSAPSHSDMNRKCNTKLPSFPLAGKSFRTFAYDIDTQLSKDMNDPKHAAICISSSGPAGPNSITWLRSTKKRFTIHYVPMPKDASQNCPENPFEQPLPDPKFAFLRVDTGAPDVKVKDCMYQVEIGPQDSPAADPHIIVN
jgi:hypothetical protein